MSVSNYYNFNNRNANNAVLNVQTGLYDLSLIGTLTNISFSNTYQKFGNTSLYRSVSDGASKSYYSTNVTLANSFTVAFWIRTIGGSAQEGLIRVTDGTYYVLFYLSNGTSPNFIQFQVNGDPTFYGMYLKTTGLSAGKTWYTSDWNHIAFIASYNGSTTTVNVYYNGALVNYEFGTTGGGLNSSTTKVTAPANATAPVTVAGKIFSSNSVAMYLMSSPQNNGLPCYLSNVYLFQYAITSAELTNLINNNYTNSQPMVPLEYPCFLEGSKILRFNPDTYTEEYVAVEKLRKHDLILTSESGYKMVHSIGYRTLFHPKTDANPSNRLYRFTRQNCPTVFEPLYITGEHCTLHRQIPTGKQDAIKEHMGDIYVTEECYRIPACLDDRAEPYDREDEPVTIWHFALENENVCHNYGVYANGLLVESCAIESLLEKSGMQFLE